MEAHFPWLDDGSAYFVTLRKDSEIIAGLAVREVSGAGSKVGLLGIVVVHPDHRGEGHSATILAHAIAEAERRGLAELILWTGKPRVYEKMGFSVSDSGLFGEVRHPGGSVAFDTAPWSDKSRGVPPFARSLQRISTPAASAVIIDGATVAEWTGEPEALLPLLASALPETFRLNALSGDALVAAMIEAGWSVDLKPTRLQMVCPLGGGAFEPPAFRLLDRV